MKRSTGQTVVLVFAGALGAGTAMAWANWVWSPGLLELSHRGLSFDLAGVPTYLTMVGAGLIFAIALVFLAGAFKPSTEIGGSVLQMLLAAGAATPAVLLLTRLSERTYFNPAADAGVGLWLTLIASAGVVVGAAMVIGAAIRERRTARIVTKEEVTPPVRLRKAA